MKTANCVCKHSCLGLVENSLHQIGIKIVQSNAVIRNSGVCTQIFNESGDADGT